jgi:hypothetical protein
MAFTNGQLVVTQTGGTPAVVNAGPNVLQDGVYTITVTRDNTGVSLTINTPYGATGQAGFTIGDDIE